MNKSSKKTTNRDINDIKKDLADEYLNKYLGKLTNFKVIHNLKRELARVLTASNSVQVEGE